MSLWVLYLNKILFLKKSKQCLLSCFQWQGLWPASVKYSNANNGLCVNYSSFKLIEVEEEKPEHSLLGLLQERCFGSCFSCGEGAGRSV